MPLNPEIAAFLQLVEEGRAADHQRAMHELSPREARLAFDRTSLMLNPGAEELDHVEELVIPARDGTGLPARLYAARHPRAGEALPVLLYFHGGGYVVGSLDSHDALCRALALRSGCAVLAPAYRLAPEHRFPTAFEDALDSLLWLEREGGGLGLDASRLAVGGDSVGASLTAALCARLARGVEPVRLRPRLQVLIYPVTDATAETDSLNHYARGHLLEKATLDWFYRQYARQDADRRDERFSPLLGEPPAGTAPALMVLAECDPLLDEGLAYARKLEQAGIGLELEVYAGMTHDFLRMGALVDEAEEAQQRIADAVKRALHQL
jgi:acetyl esterase